MYGQTLSPDISHRLRGAGFPKSAGCLLRSCNAGKAIHQVFPKTRDTPHRFRAASAASLQNMPGSVPCHIIYTGRASRGPNLYLAQALDAHVQPKCSLCGRDLRSDLFDTTGVHRVQCAPAGDVVKAPVQC